MRHYQVRILLTAHRQTAASPLKCKATTANCGSAGEMDAHHESGVSRTRGPDLMFPGGGPRSTLSGRGESARRERFGTRVRHRAQADPLSSDGHPCVGLDSSSDMLAEAPLGEVRSVAVEWMQGDMRAFDLGGTSDFVFISANSLLHLHEVEDLVSCFRSVADPS